MSDLFKVHNVVRLKEEISKSKIHNVATRNKVTQDYNNINHSSFMKPSDTFRPNMPNISEIHNDATRKEGIQNQL